MNMYVELKKLFIKKMCYIKTENDLETNSRSKCLVYLSIIDCVHGITLLSLAETSTQQTVKGRRLTISNNGLFMSLTNCKLRLFVFLLQNNL